MRRVEGTDWALALLRVVIGSVFLAHGLQKVVVWGVSGGAPFFRDAGIPLPEVAAPLVAGIETLAGAAVLVGWFTRSAAGLLAAVMLVAALVVHLPHGFFLPNGAEFTITLAGACLAIAIAGPGQLSFDARLETDLGAP